MDAKASRNARTGDSGGKRIWDYIRETRDRYRRYGTLDRHKTARRAIICLLHYRPRTFLHGFQEALMKSAGPRFVSSGPALSSSIAMRSKLGWRSRYSEPYTSSMRRADAILRSTSRGSEAYWPALSV